MVRMTMMILLLGLAAFTKPTTTMLNHNSASQHQTVLIADGDPPADPGGYLPGPVPSEIA